MADFDKDLFLKSAISACINAGIEMRRLQNLVTNEPKDADPQALYQSEAEQSQARAKTAADEIAQDILLAALSKRLPLNDVVLDAEENTPLTALFPAMSGRYTLVIDPLDGTLLYLRGKKAYAIHVGLFENGNLICAVVYYPAFDRLYYSCGNENRLCEEASRHGLKNKKEISMAESPMDNLTIFCSGQSLPKHKQALDELGIKRVSLLPDLSRYEGSMEFLKSGGIACAIVTGMQVRDLIHAAILINQQGGLYDYYGTPIGWPDRGGAMPEAILSPWPIPAHLFSALRS